MARNEIKSSIVLAMPRRGIGGDIYSSVTLRTCLVAVFTFISVSKQIPAFVLMAFDGPLFNVPERYKWHFRALKLQNFTREHALSLVIIYLLSSMIIICNETQLLPTNLWEMLSEDICWFAIKTGKKK